MIVHNSPTVVEGRKQKIGAFRRSTTKNRQPSQRCSSCKVVVRCLRGSLTKGVDRWPAMLRELWHQAKTVDSIRFHFERLPAHHCSQSGAREWKYRGREGDGQVSSSSFSLDCCWPDTSRTHKTIQWVKQQLLENKSISCESNVWYYPVNTKRRREHKKSCLLTSPHHQAETRNFFWIKLATRKNKHTSPTISSNNKQNTPHQPNTIHFNNINI